MSHHTSPFRPLKAGFTLMEVMVSSFLMVLVMGMLFSILIGTMNAWEGGTTSLQTNSDARMVLDMVSRDLQSMVVRQTTSDQHWLSSQPVEVDSGISGLESTWLTFFAPAIDRAPGQQGDIVAISYRTAFQDPVSTTDLYKVFGLYKYMATTSDTFQYALGQTDIISGFWNAADELDRTGFLIPNIARFEIAWWVKQTPTAVATRIGPDLSLMLNNSLWIGPPTGTLVEYPEATIEAADITLTILSEEGMQQAEVFEANGSLNSSKVNELIERFGNVHTARVSISY